MHQHAESCYSVDVFGGFEVVEEVGVFKRGDGGDTAGAELCVDPFADGDECAAIDRPVGMVVGDSGRFGFAFEPQVDDVAVFVGLMPKRAGDDGAGARFDFRTAPRLCADDEACVFECFQAA